MITTPDLGEFFIEVERPVPASGARRTPMPADVQRFVAAAAHHHHWLATREKNAAVGIVVP